MALTPSKMIPLGTTAPDFKLPDTVSGKILTLAELKSDRASVILFICNHCPYVQQVRQQLIDVALDYGPRGIAFVAISANDAENYPDDAPEKMKLVAGELGYPFPFLYDESQEVAKAYGAACTPDLFVFDGELKLVYRGQLDDARPGADVPVTGRDLREALDCILDGRPVSSDQKPSMGCNIKWKAG
jgi:peroxiredoxin